MVLKFNRILILFFIFIILTIANQSVSVGQTASAQVFLPVISHDPTRWIGPSGGTIVAIAKDPTNPQVTYAGTFGAGVYKSTDGGQTWNSSSAGLSNLYIYSLAIDPSHPSTIYAGTYHSQIFKSVDAGVSWKWSGTGMQDQAIVYSIAIDPFEPSKIYAATRGLSNNCDAPWNGVVYRSADAGQSWMPSLANLGSTQDWVYSLLVDPNAHDNIYAAAHENGVYKSVNEGGNWYPIQNGISDLSGRSIAISPDYSPGTTLYYGAWHFDSLYKTLNGGNSWFRPDPNIPLSKVYSVAIDPQNPNTVYLATINRGILKTTDGGLNWPYGSLFDDDIYSIAIDGFNSANILAGTAGDGIFRSSDYSVNWQRSNSGLNNATVTSIVSSSADPASIYTSVFGAGVNRSSNLDISWSDFNIGLTDKYIHSLVVDPARPWLIYALTDSEGLFQKNLSNGNGWTRIGIGLPLTQYIEPTYPVDHPFATLDMQEKFPPLQEGPPAVSSTSDQLLQMVFAPSNPSIVYLGTGKSGIYKSTDGGTNWYPDGLIGKSILGLAVDPIDPNLVYAVASDPSACAYSGSLLISSNGGSQWNPASLSGNFYSIAASRTESGVVYAGTGNGIYRYKNNNWSQPTLANQVITTITLDFVKPGFIYAGTENGAYYSADGGSTWKYVNQSLQGIVIESITVDYSYPNLLYFGTKTYGIFRTAIP
jgi:photosystem II stability/assembly factor-like uncharacterized protein